jgi:hypothetical protein
MFFAESQFSPRTESREDSLDSDMFSISDSSDDIELLDPQETVYPMLNNILHQLLAGFRTATQYQSSPGESGENSGAVASTTESAHTGNTSRSSRKRKPQQDEEDGTGEDDSHPPPPKKFKSGQGEKPQKLFACPYLKWDPIKYKRCCERKLSRISDVKLHLIRKHTPKRYCQVCQATNFPDQQSLQKHINIRKCSRRDPAMLIGISYEQRDQLHRKSKPKSGDYSKEDQWFAIWEILFQAHRRPTSVYMDADLTLEMRQFRAYCDNVGPAIVREHLESDPACRGFGITGEQRQVLDRLIAQGLTTLFDNWGSRNSSASTTPECQSNDNPQQSRYETPTSSLVDSGMGMGGQSSSRGINSQGSKLPPTLRIPAVGFSSQPAAADARARSPSPVQEVPVAPNLTDVPTFASPPLGFVAGGQEWSRGGQVDGFEARLPATFENNFDFDAFPSLENTSGFFPEFSQSYWNGGPS